VCNRVFWAKRRILNDLNIGTLMGEEGWFYVGAKFFGVRIERLSSLKLAYLEA